MDVDVTIGRFLDHARRRRLAPSTQALYRRQLAAWLAWRRQQGYAPSLSAVDTAELRAFFVYLSEQVRTGRGARRGSPGLQPRTVGGYYRTLRVLFRWLEYEEDETGHSLLTERQMRIFRNHRIPLPAIERREGPALSEADYRRLLQAAAAGESQEQQARDELILRLLWETGLRVHELAGLTDAAIQPHRRMAVLVGKGNKEGVVFWGRAASAALRRYLAVRRGKAGGPLLRGVSSRNNGEAVTPNLIRCLVKRLARQAGVTLPLGSPCHAFRRAFARRARLGGATEEEVGQLLRDSTPVVIRTYLGNDVEPRRRIYDRVFDAVDGEAGQTGKS